MYPQKGSSGHRLTTKPCVFQAQRADDTSPRIAPATGRHEIAGPPHGTSARSAGGHRSVSPFRYLGRRRARKGTVVSAYAAFEIITTTAVPGDRETNDDRDPVIGRRAVTLWRRPSSSTDTGRSIAEFSRRSSGRFTAGTVSSRGPRGRRPPTTDDDGVLWRFTRHEHSPAAGASRVYCRTD